MSPTYPTQRNCMTHDDIPTMLRRLQVRLRLAEFKRKNGYEKYDLYTLEKNLLRVTKCYRALLRPPSQATTTKSKQHRYYPTFPVSTKCNDATTRSMLLLATHVQGPLSAKRDTPPRRIKSDISSSKSSSPSTSCSSSDEEDAAKLLVMLHHHHHNHNTLSH
ncbi:hypothetical protein O0I10_004864 [Lichtheimia ornata]|uniref:Uncharacterized protein n=1 Tax=Lichtheimia ornata TaxID=688661 RepID=A0AAD7V539_9FUNG|nr:uncharacterized protein O0I10_004864 [Lichtheimia ornata]KAJ8659499.1 hypothetical protein O0I10_004864 [Lichtheimia ornata]